MSDGLPGDEIAPASGASALTDVLGVDCEAAPMDEIGKAAILVLSPEMLAELLQLPEGCHIDSAVAPHDHPGVLHLRVRGAGWPTKAGWLLPQTQGIVTKYHAEDGTVLRHKIDWGFPTDTPNA